MRKVCLCLLFLACVFGQDSLTITASRSITPQPDQAVFAVYVTSPLTTSLDDVVAALTAAGITAGNLSNVSSFLTITGNSSQGNLSWSFTLNVPFSKLKDTIATLTLLQQTMGQNKSGLQLSYSGQGTAVSAQLQASQSCPIAALIADARAQAQTLANAAGAMVGPILALADASSAGNSGAGTNLLFQATPAIVLYSGVFTFSSVSTAVFNPVSCAIVVKFSLLRTQ